MSNSVKINKLENIDFKKMIDDKNDTIVKIFSNIKMQNWKEVIAIILETNIDLNIQDNSNIYLLEYAIIFNQIELLDILLKKNVRIDITDDLSRSILYNVIKFSYTDILIKLLEKNKTIIGKSILEIKDSDSNIPLFYAIKFFNLVCVEKILSYTTNLYIKNNDGDNALHLSIKSQNFDLFKIVLDNFKDLKAKNANGESYLHLIIKYKCYDMLELMISKFHTDTNFIDLLNYVESQYNFTILHYICIELDFYSLQILSKSNLFGLINGNVQDNSGNIFYHYFINNIINITKLNVEIINNIINMNELFKHINFNINLYNIDGNTPAHIFFSNINYFANNKLNILINWIGEKSDMNIQNFNGESVFYLIVKNNYWKQIYNILITKKIDIFIIGEDSNTIFDYIDSKDYGEFLKMITLSYLFQLSNSSSSEKWLEYWDNRCKKIVKYGELNETELELVKSIGIKKISSDNNICYEIIYNKIDKSIGNFIENKNIFESTSFPVSNKFKKLISNYPTVVISTFSGSTIDVLSGLIYLSKKINKIKKNYLTTSIKFIENQDNVVICKYLSDNDNNHNQDQNNKLCEIKNFEILWVNKNINFPSNKNNNLSNILNWINKNKSDGSRWFIIPLGIEIGSYSHANYLIFDFELMQVERFEPHGGLPPVGLNYNPEYLDSILSNYLDNIGLQFEYIKPSDYLPNIGFQIKEINELKSDYIGDPNGFCALWCIWWADLRLSNPDISRKKLVKYVGRELINGKYSYRKLIRDYSWYITEIRDKLFLKANTNINEWINDTIPDKNIDLLNIAIREEISDL
jgi:ankyrin repeat protein